MMLSPHFSDTELGVLGIASHQMVNTLGRSIELWTATEATKATEG
jgi:hypothetical protein